MRILALQLKRLGDFVLTTPALRALLAAWPEARLTVGVMAGTAPLLDLVPVQHGGIIFGAGRGWTPWQQVMTGGWDLCLDFTGNDRSSLALALSRARTRAGFVVVRRNRLRALAGNAWCESKVRDAHTAQHYLDLAGSVMPVDVPELRDLQPILAVSAGGALHPQPYALFHPGTARPEKYWLPERWAELIAHVRTQHGLDPVITSGPDAFEQAHARAIVAGTAGAPPEVRFPRDVAELCRWVAAARLVISCDTAVVHVASAYRIPQVALFGPTNPFHWRPLHEKARVISAADPGAPLAAFDPRMKGAPTDRISTATVIGATDSLLASLS